MRRLLQLCGTSYAFTYSAPSILPFAVACYEPAEQRVGLWMLVLQSAGDVAGRLFPKDLRHADKYCAALAMPLVYGVLAACAWWPGSVRAVLPFHLALWAFPACTFVLSFSHGHLSTGFYMQNKTVLDASERYQRARVMDFTSKIGATGASVLAFVYASVLARRRAAGES